MKKLFKNNKLIVTGVLLGAVVGYLYYSFIGCSTGTCNITSKPLNSTIYFAVLGGLVFSLFKNEVKQKENKNAGE